MKRYTVIILVAIITIIPFQQFHNHIFGAVLSDGVEPESGRYWIYFTDKGERVRDIPQSLSADNLNLSERAIERRIRRSGVDGVLPVDIPVYGDYVQALRDSGLQIKTVSRFLNAVSVYATADDLGKIESLPFVSRITPVATCTRAIPEQYPIDRLERREDISLALDYGNSDTQLNLINVPPLHEDGLNGRDIIIGVFDTGFLTDHPAFDFIDILATYDFINDDEDVSDNDQTQMNHGTAVLSIVGGRDEGELYGPAYGATYVLAKTESVSEEIQAEEDNFIAALEWADSIGCDIVSASLGYIDWYTFSELDGNTSPLTNACDAAVQRGMTVVVAGGNERDDSWGHINVPADGDSVIAVGAVNRDGTLASFSSPGPSADGRIKPDIMAQGTAVVSASLSGGYKYSSGTSAATPLTAGAIALLLQSHPQWGPIDVRTALWGTASEPNDEQELPNNDFGYGIVNAAEADSYQFIPVLKVSEESLSFTAFFGDSNPEPQTIQLSEKTGQLVEWTASWNSEWLTIEPGSGETPSIITASVDIEGLQLGEYSDTLIIESDSASNSPFEIPIQLRVREIPPEVAGAARAYPNPFTDEVIFEFNEVGDNGGAIYIFTVEGIKVFERDLAPGEFELTWDGRNNSGNEVAGGFYLVKITGVAREDLLKIFKTR